MSSTIVAVIVNLLAVLLPYIGVDFDSEKVNSSIQTLVALVTGIWIWYQRTQMRKITPSEESDITPLGVRK